MHLAPLIYDLAVILAVAGIISAVFIKIRQPVVLGYILAGVVVGPHTPPFLLVTDVAGIQTWAELGVIFLMFTLGLEFSFKKLTKVGRTAGITAGLELIFFLPLGYYIGRYQGWSHLESIFLGAMLLVSSTTIIIKALDELKLKTHRFAGLIFGILIVEDLIAILLMVTLTTIATSHSFSGLDLIGATLNLLLIVGSWFMLGQFIVPKLMSFVAKKGTNEMLTLFSIGLCLLLVVLATKAGYSAALGAFIMGSILAEAKVIHTIESLMSPLKDLFGAIFFVSIGMLINPVMIWEMKGMILLLSLVVIFGKIFIATTGTLVSGQSFKNSLQVGFGMAQIGEFSFIIAALGASLKVTNAGLYPLAVAVSVITTFTTPFLIKLSGPLSDAIEAKLPEKTRSAMRGYVLWWEKKSNNQGPTVPAKLMFRWVLNGIIVIVIFNNAFKGLRFFIEGNLYDLAPWSREISLLMAIVFSLPFLWGMLFASRRAFNEINRSDRPLEALLLICFPLLTAILLTVLIGKQFRLIFVLPATTVFMVGVYFLLYKRLDSTYKWFEEKFVSTFAQTPGSGPMAGLAPWGTHLYSFQVHPNAELVNLTLEEAQLRPRMGVNVVAIKRGHQTIIPPTRHERILPMDDLIVLGTDEQMDKLRPATEAPPGTEFDAASEDYALEGLRLSPQSELVGKTIAESKFRQQFKALIVGIERGNERFMNPSYDFMLQVGDTIWVVGDRGELSKIKGFKSEE